MIDIHILADPQFPVQPMVDSLNHPSISVHVRPHIEGDLLGARRAGYAAGEHEFVSWVDPDDRVISLDWIGDALQILEDEAISAVYPRWVSTKGGAPKFLVPVHEWHPIRSHERGFPFAHQLTIMRRKHVQLFFDKAFTGGGGSGIEPLLTQSMKLHGKLVALPALAYEWKLRDNSARSRKNNREFTAWANSLYLSTRHR